MTESDFQLDLLKIPVSDLQRASAFYCGTLGWEERLLAVEYGWAELSAGTLRVALYRPGMGGGDGTMGGSLDFHLGLCSTGFNAVVRQIRDTGTPAGAAVHQSDDGSPFLELLDPDGNSLKVMRIEPQA